MTGLMDILKNVNWVDVVVLLIAIRVVYISAQTGFVIEFLKMLAALTALFVCFHYYSVLGAAVQKTFFSAEILAATAFVVLWMLVLLICKFIREGLLKLFSVKAEGSVDKWGAVVIAVGRGLIVASMCMFLFLASGQKYLRTMTLTSLSGSRILRASPVIYQETCDRFITRLFPKVKKNPAVGQTLRDVAKK